MKLIFKMVFLLIVLQVIITEAQSQITINGYNPRRYSSAGIAQNTISVSYGYNLWVDGESVALTGYSSSLGFFHDFSDPLSIESSNYSVGVTVGYERQISSKLAIRGAFTTTKLVTGTSTRFDLSTTDKSKYTQFGVYARYLLTKQLQHRIQFQWLVGPELIFAKKDVFIDEYVLDESSEPETYRQNISIVEGAVVTGLGISCRITKKFSLFSDSMFGVSLPGKGFKSTNTGFGLKYVW